MGAVLTVAVFKPGFMDADAVVQLGQARGDWLGDWHPPVMTWVWRYLDRLHPGPIGMLALHSLVLWSGLGLAAYLTVARWYLAPPLIWGLGFFPPVVALVSTVTKDAAMGAFLLLGAMLVLLAERRRVMWPLVAAGVTWTYAAAVRYNAAPALLPLALWAGSVAMNLRRSGVRWYARMAAGGLILVSVSGIAMGTTRVLTTAPGYMTQVSFIFDLAAISVARQEVLLPEHLSEGISLEDLRKMYTPESVVPLLWGDETIRRVPLKFDEASFLALRKQWLRVVSENPRPYLAHKVAGYRALLAVDRVCSPYHQWIDVNDLGVVWKETKLNALALRALSTVRESLLFRPWVYVLLAMVGTAVGWFSRGWKRAPMLALGTSGLLYEASYFLPQQACYFRYSWWLVLSTLLIVVLLVVTPRSASVPEGLKPAR